MPSENDIYKTKASLLERIKDGDDISWLEFHTTYKKFIWCIARDYNVRDVDREDVINDVMAELFRTRDRFQYDPNKGRFRDYLRRVVQHHILHSRKKQLGMDNLDDDTYPEPWIDDFSRVWKNEWEQHVLEQAQMILSKRLDPIAYQVFTMLNVEGTKPEEVARHFGLKADQVYAIRFKAKELLKLYRNVLDS